MDCYTGSLCVTRSAMYSYSCFASQVTTYFPREWNVLFVIRFESGVWTHTPNIRERYTDDTLKIILRLKQLTSPSKSSSTALVRVQHPRSRSIRHHQIFKPHPLSFGWMDFAKGKLEPTANFCQSRGPLLYLGSTVNTIIRKDCSIVFMLMVTHGFSWKYFLSIWTSCFITNVKPLLGLSFRIASVVFVCVMAWFALLNYIAKASTVSKLAF